MSSVAAPADQVLPTTTTECSQLNERQAAVAHYAGLPATDTPIPCCLSCCRMFSAAEAPCLILANTQSYKNSHEGHFTDHFVALKRSQSAECMFVCLHFLCVVGQELSKEMNFTYISRMVVWLQLTLSKSSSDGR